MKKLNIALLTVLVMFQTILGPFGTYGVTFAEGTPNSTGTITDDIMTLVELSQKDSTDKLVDLTADGYRVDAEKEVSVLYTFNLLKANNYKSGDTYVLQLPEAFVFTEQHAGDLMLNETETLGTFQVNPNLETVTFTFNSLVEGKDIEGKFGAWVAFTEGVKQGELEQDIVFDNPNKTFNLKFAPAGGETTKTAVANKLMNADTVTWTVDINKASRAINSAKLSDTTTSTPSNHTLSGEIEVYEITKVLINGDVEVNSTPYKKFDKFPIDLGNIKEPYRVVYKSELTDNITTEFTNTANLTGTENGKSITQSSTFDIELPFYDHLVKQKNTSNEGQNITWTVLYNYDEKEIGSTGVSGVITDSLTNNYTGNATKSGHKYIESSVKVEKIEGAQSTLLTEGTDYSSVITDETNGQKLVITLKENQKGSKAGYKLTYDTVAEDVVADFKVSNIVTADSDTAKEDSTVKQTFFYKGYTVDYEKKEITWTITSTGFDMKDAVLTDTLDPTLNVFGKPSIKIGSTPLNDFDFEKTGGNLVLDFSKSDTTTWSASDKLEITYVTPIPDASNKTDYKNTAGITWKNSKDEWVIADSITVTTELKDHTKNNGYKNGQYNYSGDKYRTIDWEVGYNFNLDTSVTGEITDTWDNNQQFVTGSKITITPVELKADGTWNRVGTPVDATVLSATPTGFTFDVAAALGGDWSAGKPYILNYSTKFKDDIIPAAANNKVTFTGKSNHPYEVKDTVNISHGTEYVDKTANITSKDKHIQWSVFLNKSQSTIPAGSELVDKPKGHQKILLDTVKVFKLKPVVSSDGKASFVETTEELTSPSIKVELKKDTQNNNKEYLSVQFPGIIEHAYVVKYDTYIASMAGSFSNEVEFEGVASLTGKVETDTEIATIAESSGAWGFGNIADPWNMSVIVKKQASGNYKYDVDKGKALADATFVLYLDNVEKARANANLAGMVTFTGLEPNAGYTVKELTPPIGYKLNNAAQAVKLNTDKTGYADLVFENDRLVYDGSFKNACTGITDGKYTVEGNNQTFTIDVIAGVPTLGTDAPIVNLNTDEVPEFSGTVGTTILSVDKYNDSFRIENLPPGTYKITQVEATPGYVVGNSTTLIIGTDKTTITNANDIECTPLNVTITNIEKDDPTSPIKGSSFKVYRVVGNCPTPDGDGKISESDLEKYTLVSGVVTTTDDNGEFKIDFSKLGKGLYIVVQDQVNPYYVNKGNVPVEFDGSLCIEIDETTTPPTNPPVFENERDGKALPKVKLVKTETTAQGGNPLEGAVITLTGEQKGNKYVGRTNEFGEIGDWYSGDTYPTDPTAIPVDKIVSDKYTLTETTYPKGYTNLNVTEFDYHNGIKTQAEATINVTNEKILVDLTIENACGKDSESTYEILDSSKVRVTADVLNKLLSDYTTVKAYDGSTEITGKVIIEDDGLITMPAGATKLVLKELHLAAGEYSIKQLDNKSDDCLSEDNPGTIVVPNVPNPPIFPVDETDKPIYSLTLKFESCEGLVTSGIYTITGKGINEGGDDAVGKKYTIDASKTSQTTGYTIYDSNNKVVERIPKGVYEVTEPGMTVIRTIEVTDDSLKNKFTVLTEDCGQIVIEFDRCDKFQSQGIAIYKADASNQPEGNALYTAKPTFENGKVVTITKESLPVGSYVVVAFDKAGNENFNVTKAFKVTSQGEKVKVELEEDCGVVEQPITFDKCDRSSTSTVDVYKVTTNADGTIDTTNIIHSGLDASTGTATVDLPVGKYIIVPGGSTNFTDSKVITVDEETITLPAITITENCDGVTVNIEFDRCDKNGFENIDIFKDGVKVNTVSLTDNGTVWIGSQNLTEGTYTVTGESTNNVLTTFEITEEYFIHEGNQTKLDSTNTVLLEFEELCNPVPVEITLISCDQLGTTTVDIYEVDSNDQLISSSIKSITVVNGKVTENLGEGSYVILLGGTTAFKTTDIIKITESTTGPIPVTITQDCNTATITFKSCDAPIGNTSFKFDDGKGNTFTTSTDRNGVISKTVPPGVYTVTNTTTNVSKVIDITSSITNLIITDCEACTAQVKVPELADQTVTISNGSIIETVKVNENGEFTIPFTDGTLIVKDSTGKVVGTITVTDCKGTFDYPRCENPNIPLPGYENQSMFILSQTEVGGVITSPDTTTIDVATITTSEDTVTVDTDGKLTIDKSKLTDEGLEYYIVDSLGNILKIIKLDSESIVVYTTNRDEEARIEECVPKNPIPIEPKMVEPIPPGPGDGDGGTDPGPNPDPEDPNNPGGEDPKPEDPNNPNNPGGEDPKPEDPNNPNNPDGEDPKPEDPNNPNNPDGEDPKPEDPNNPNNPDGEDPKPEDPNNPNNPDGEDPNNPNNPDGEDPNNPNNPDGENPNPENPTNPTNPGTTTPPTLPGLEEAIKSIPPSVLPTPGNPLTPGEVAAIVEKYSKDPAERDALVNGLKGLLDYYESLSPEQKAAFEDLYDVNGLNMMLNELEKVASLQMKLPQTDGASQLGMMLVGSALLLAGAWLFVTRRRKA